MRKRLLTAGLVVVAAVAVVLATRGEPNTVDRTAAWTNDHACTAVTRSPTRRERVVLTCDHLGGFVVYERFASPRALREALGHSRGKLCVHGREALTIDLLVNGPTVTPLCRHLGGRVAG